MHHDSVVYTVNSSHLTCLVSVHRLLWSFWNERSIARSWTLKLTPSSSVFTKWKRRPAKPRKSTRGN